MSDVETNCLLAEFLGMTALPGMMDGAYWDAEVKRTRMVRDSEMHKLRKTRGITERESNGFVFDVFTRQDDLERVERAALIEIRSATTRVAAVLQKIAVRKP